ncbi:flippase [archaeon]|nr:flippase [archaeon]
MRTYSERIAKGTFAVLILGLIGTILGYALRIYLAHNLSIAEFGLFYSVLAFLSFFGAFKDLGLSSAIVKLIPEFQVKKQMSSIKTIMKTSISVQVIIGVIISASLFFLADLISVSFFHNAAAKIVIQILSIEFFLGFSVLKAIINGIQKIKLYSVIEPVRIIFIFAFLGVFIKLGAQGAALSYLSSAILINVSLAVYIVMKIYRPYFKSKENPAVIGTFLKFGLIMFAGTIASMLISTTDTLMVTFFLSLKDVALYQAAMPTAQLLIVFSSAIGVVMLPVASEMWSSNKKKILGTAASLILKFLFVCIIPFVLIFVTFPEIILNIFFGSSYIDASPLLQILSVGMIFYGLYAVMFTMIIGIGKPKTATKIVVYTAVLNFILNLALINIIGITGAAISAIISYLTAMILSYRVLRKHFTIDFNVMDIVKIFLCGAVATFVIFLIKDILATELIIEAVISLVIGFAVYSVLVLLSRTVKKSDIKMLDEINIRIPKPVMRFLYRIVRQ